MQGATCDHKMSMADYHSFFHFWREIAEFGTDRTFSRAWDQVLVLTLVLKNVRETTVIFNIIHFICIFCFIASGEILPSMVRRARFCNE